MKWISLPLAWAVAAGIGLYRAPSVRTQGPLFGEGAQVPVGSGSGQVILVDVNRDGHLDMVTRHLVQRKVGIFVGDGKGGFRPSAASPIALDYQPGAIAMEDVNGDLVVDLIAAQSERDAVDVYFGDGTGGFTHAPGSPLKTGASQQFFTRGLWLLDANGDGHRDIFSTNGRENSFAILFGDGHGHFSEGPSVRRNMAPQQRYTFAFDDVTGDGHVDAAIAAETRQDDTVPREPGRITVLQGDARGELTQELTQIAVASNPHFMTLADTNGDRRADLVISHGGSHRVSVLLNNGAGQFAQAPGSPISIGAEAWTVVVEDVDGDGKRDLLCATGTSVTVLLGDGRGRFTPAPGSPFHAGPGAYRVTAADINEDGKLDVAASAFDGEAVTVLIRR